VGIVKLLLDTCAFLWLAQQPTMLSKSAAAAIDEPGNELFLSDVSVLEVVMKHSAGKLPMPAPPREWFPDRLEFHQVTTIPQRETVIYMSGELPRVHNDPFDRLIAAEAIESGMTVVSPDGPISDLGASRIW